MIFTIWDVDRGRDFKCLRDWNQQFVNVCLFCSLSEWGIEIINFWMFVYFVCSQVRCPLWFPLSFTGADSWMPWTVTSSKFPTNGRVLAVIQISKQLHRPVYMQTAVTAYLKSKQLLLFACTQICYICIYTMYICYVAIYLYPATYMKSTCTKLPC